MITGTSNPVATCRWCGMLHGPMCPSVKAIEYHRDGSIRRVEFKCASDFALPMWNPPQPPVYTPTIPPVTWSWAKPKPATSFVYVTKSEITDAQMLIN